MTKLHPTSARAWASLGWLARSEPELALRSFARCLKLEPANTGCKQRFEAERADYVRPYCEGGELRRVALEWRETSLKPFAGAAPIEHQYETYHLAPAARFRFEDVVRVDATETLHVSNRADGTVDREQLPGVRFTLAPGKLDTMVAWTRELERRGDGYAVMLDGKLLYVARYGISDDSSPGITGVAITDYCTKTKTRALPPLD
jgi:hypothetical protein